MSEWVQNAAWTDRLRIQAWLSSMAVHALVIGLIMVFGARMSLSPQEEPFRWNVAMIEPVASSESAAPAPPVETPAPPTQAPPPKRVVQQMTKPTPVERRVETAIQPIMQTVETKPREQPVERTIQTVEAVQPMERVPDVRPSTVETPTIAAPQAESAPAVIERATQMATTNPAPAEQMVETRPIQAMGESVQRTEVAHQPAPVVEQIAPLVAERAAPQPVEELTPVMRHPVETAPIAHTPVEPADASRATERTTHETVTQEERTVVAKASPTPTPRARADYGWVREALWRRIVEMKHYPSQARLNHLEGKVILRAVIRADGHLGDLSIKESSGHRVLDDAAMEVIRRICPVPLKHDLGKPEIVVMIPIDYRLE